MTGVPYELWDTKTSNAIGSFATQEEALAVVREALDQHGREYAETLFLGCEDKDGRSRPIAQGKGIVELALQRTPQALGSRDRMKTHGSLYCLCGASWVWTLRRVPTESADALRELWLGQHSGEGHGLTDSGRAYRARVKADQRAAERAA